MRTGWRWAVGVGWAAGTAMAAEPPAPWALGRFERPRGANPAITARLGVFQDPLRGQPVNWEGSFTFNPAAVVKDGRVWVLYRAEDDFSRDGKDRHVSRIGLAESTDGLYFQRRSAPVLFPAADAQKDLESDGGCENPRAIEAEDGTIVLTYTQWNRKQAQLAVATSKDLVNWIKHGPAFEAGLSPNPTGGAIVGRLVDGRIVATKIGGKYWMFWGGDEIRAATSGDLLRWTPVKGRDGQSAAVLAPRPGRFDAAAVHPGPPPALTERGIVLLYNGRGAPVKSAAGGEISGPWAVGQALLDPTDPLKVLDRAAEPCLKPELPFETTGQYDAGGTFAEGLVFFGGRWLLYYGCADTRVGVAAWDPSGQPVNPPAARKAKRARSAELVERDDAGRWPLRGGWDLIAAPETNLKPEEIARPALDTAAWLDATVPGTVMTTLIDQGIEPDPLHGLNNLSISEKYCRQDWWYRRVFAVPAGLEGQRLWLEFDGINYAAEVWLNGKKVGDIKGAFIRGQFDVTDVARRDGPNVLAVRVSPPPTPARPHEQSLGLGAGRNGGDLVGDGPTFGCTMGWDWIPGIRDRASGLWQDVALRATGPVLIEHPQVVTTVPDPSRAEIAVTVGLRNAGGGKQGGRLVGRIGEVSFEQPASDVGPKGLTLSFTPSSHPQLAFRHPRLWWPNGIGRPELYDLDLAFVGADGRTSDARRVTFGIRELGYEVHRDAAMELILKINGRRIFCRGGNWGLDEALKRVPPERYNAWLRMHRDANLNMVRNWVGQDTSEAFFRACDRMGIMVFSDFWLANPWDGPDPKDERLFLRNAEDVVLRYRNHPSIVLWCARNESTPKPLFADDLYDAVWKHDTTRIFLSDSASFGASGRGPYRLMPVDHYFTINRGFKTELGIPCPPTAESMKAMLDERDWWPVSDAWAYHDFCRKGAMAVDTYLGTMEAKFGAPAGIDDFCRKAQMLNYEAYRAALEAWNLRMWRGSSCLLFWMSHPCWPSTVWQLYAHDLEPTAALFGAQKACEPVHIQLHPRDGTVSVVNTSDETLAGATVTAETFDLASKPLGRASAVTGVAANAVCDVLTLPAARAAASTARLARLELKDASGRLRSENFYWLADKDEDLRALREPAAKLQAAATARREAGGGRVSVELKNPSGQFAIMVRLALKDAKTGARVLPVFYGDNYLTLAPGASRSVTIECAGRDLPASVRVDVAGWNTAAVSAECAAAP